MVSWFKLRDLLDKNYRIIIFNLDGKWCDFFLYDCIPFLFISDVASLFHSIEIQSKDLQKKYKRAESIIREPDNCDRMRQDIQSMKHNWAKEFTCISRFDIAHLKGQKTSSIKVLLTMAKGFVGNSTCSIKKKQVL